MSYSTESKWALQDAAQQILGGEWRTSSCLRRQNNGVTCVHVNGDKAHYSGLQTCGSVWVCPICAIKIATRRRDEVKIALNNSGYTAVLVTYTIQHSRIDKLKTLLDDLKAGLRHTLNGRFRKEFYNRFNVAGYVRSVEIRWSPKNGWHPHVHELLLVNGRPDKQGIEDFLSHRYMGYLRDHGYHTNEHTISVSADDDNSPDDLVSDYLTKSPVELELTAGHLKDSYSLSQFQLLAAMLETGESFYGDLFREFAEATRGRKWLTWSRGLRAELLPDEPEESDNELAERVEDGSIVALLNRDEWGAIVAMKLRGELLDVAAKGQNVQTWLKRKGIRKHIRERE